MLTDIFWKYTSYSQSQSGEEEKRMFSILNGRDVIHEDCDLELQSECRAARQQVCECNGPSTVCRLLGTKSLTVLPILVPVCNTLIQILHSYNNKKKQG